MIDAIYTNVSWALLGFDDKYYTINTSGNKYRFFAESFKDY